MALHKRMALVFFSFSSLVLVINVFTPSNPDHIFNIIEMLALSCSAIASYFLPRKVAGWLQIITLGVVAFLPMTLAMSSFFGAVLAVFMLVLVYAYDGYKTYPIQKLIATFFLVFALCVLGSSNFSAPAPEAFIRAFAWTMFIAVFLFVLWLIIDDINRRFYTEKEKKLIELNRELLEMNKKLVHGGCEDGPI